MGVNGGVSLSEGRIGKKKRENGRRREQREKEMGRGECGVMWKVVAARLRG